MVERRPKWRRAAALLALGAVSATVVVSAAFAAEHVMSLVTEGTHGRFRFDPPLVLAQPGDTVRFVPQDSMHAVKSVAGMLPEGVAPWRGRMGEELVVPLPQPGVYGVKCRSGYEVGMVGLIVVGDNEANWASAAAVRHPPTASSAFAALFAEAACALHRSPCRD
jgi:pseudoazurin